MIWQQRIAHLRHDRFLIGPSKRRLEMFVSDPCRDPTGQRQRSFERLLGAQAKTGPLACSADSVAVVAVAAVQMEAWVLAAIDAAMSGRNGRRWWADAGIESV